MGGDLERHARTTDDGAIRGATWLDGHFKTALVPLQSELRWDSEQGIQVLLDQRLILTGAPEVLADRGSQKAAWRVPPEEHETSVRGEPQAFAGGPAGHRKMARKQLQVGTG